MCKVKAICSIARLCIKIIHMTLTFDMRKLTTVQNSFYQHYHNDYYTCYYYFHC